MSLCDAYCIGCAYSTTMSNWPKACEYILVTGERRGCPAGNGCNKRLTGKKQSSIDGVVLLVLGSNETPTNADREKARKHEWYLKHRDEYLLKSERSYDKKRVKPKAATHSASEYWQGKQRAAIESFLSEHKSDCAQLALMIGVNASTVRKWRREQTNANWDRLAIVGIKRPEIE